MIVVVVSHVLIDHAISVTEAIAEILALVARQVGMTELIVVIGVRRAMSIDVMTRRVNSIPEAAVPGVGPLALRFLRLPAAFLSVNRRSGTAHQRDSEQ